jgi:sugar phosphate isomerase/epimerase
VATTRTGDFTIGFRRGWSAWQKNLTSLLAWSKANGFAAIDVGAVPQADLAEIRAAGLGIGSVDLGCPMTELVHPDVGVRSAAAAKAVAHAKMAAGEGVKNIFTVIPPAEAHRPRKENFAFAVDGFGQLCEGLLANGQKLVIEGWPGGGPHYAVLGRTPADYRALLKDLPASAGINFDPSHLVRMGIDPVRFVREFATRIHHVHAKDTAIDREGLYEHGTLQPPTFAKEYGFGGAFWRYCIPGHGEVPWTTCLSILKDAGYQGMVSIELEDERYNHSDAGEQEGLLAAQAFLCSV